MADIPTKQLANSGGEGEVITKTLTNKNKDTIVPLNIDINNFGEVRTVNYRPQFIGCKGIYDSVNFILEKSFSQVNLLLANNYQVGSPYEIMEDSNNYVLETDFNNLGFEARLLYNLKSNESLIDEIYNLARSNIYLIDTETIDDYEVCNVLKFRNFVSDYGWYNDGVTRVWRRIYYFSGTIYDNNNNPVKEITASIEYRYWNEDDNKYKIIIPKTCFSYT